MLMVTKKINWEHSESKLRALTHFSIQLVGEPELWKLVMVSGKEEGKIVSSEIKKANDGHWPRNYFKRNLNIGTRIKKKLSNFVN